MSNMISQTQQIDTDPLFPHKLRKIVFNPKQFTSSKVEQWNQDHEERQYLFLKSICKKYAIYEHQKIRQKSKEEIKQQLKDVRNHLKNCLSKNSIEGIMEKKQDKRKDYLKNITQTKMQVVDIGQKYSKKINLKLQMLNEADSIRNQKRHYRERYDRNKNDSPVLHRMSYMIEKENNFSQHFDKNKGNSDIRKSMEQSTLRYCQGAYKKKKRDYGNSPSK